MRALTRAWVQCYYHDSYYWGRISRHCAEGSAALAVVGFDVGNIACLPPKVNAGDYGIDIRKSTDAARAVPGSAGSRGRARSSRRPGLCPARYRLSLPAGPPRSTPTRCHRPGAATHQPIPPPRHRQTSPDVPRRPQTSPPRPPPPSHPSQPGRPSHHGHAPGPGPTHPHNQARKHTTNQATKNPGGSGRG